MMRNPSSRSVADPARAIRFRSSALISGVVAVVLSAAACDQGWTRGARRPQWSVRRAPLTDFSPVADHRQATELTFLVFGDSGTGEEDQRRVGRDMAAVCRASGGCDFALLAGDLIYMSGVRPPRKSPTGEWVHDSQFAEKFEIPYTPLGRLDFWAVPGNHDWRITDSVDNEVLYTYASERWRMPAHDYAVPQLPPWIHIYGLASTKLFHGVDDGQIERAEAGLCGREGWRLLFGHHPIYSSGAHADDRGLIEMRLALLDSLIEACGVHLYFSGHDHHQEHLSAGSFEQIIQGAAASPREFGQAPRVEGVQRLVASDRLGFALVRVTPQRLELRFFGHAGTTIPDEFHCRSFELAEFHRRGARSSVCGKIRSYGYGR
jgi:hypothetical protein